MTKRRLILLLLIPIEIAVLYWLGSTFYRYPHKLFTYRRHGIHGWIWQDVPLRIDGSWQFRGEEDRLLCGWDLKLSNYSRSDTIRLHQIIYTLRDRSGAKIIQHTQTTGWPAGAVDPSHGSMVVRPSRTVNLHHAFPVDEKAMVLIANAYIGLSAERTKPGR
jgi:hypothetical protein